MDKYGNFGVFCVPCEIKGGVNCSRVFSSGRYSLTRVYLCEDGYPSRNGERCELRSEPSYQRTNEYVEKGGDPLGENCLYGKFEGDYPECVLCKEGYILQLDEDNTSKCVAFTTQPEGCRVVFKDSQNDCLSCNFYSGYLPVQSFASLCYKYD